MTGQGAAIHPREHWAKPQASALAKSHGRIAEEASQQGRVINVAFGIDAEYVAHAASTIASILRHLKGRSLNVVILHNRVPEERRQELEAAVPTATFRWFEIAEQRLLGLQAKEHFGLASFFRFALPEAAADLDRIIYLDSDLTVTSDLTELWEIDLGESTLAAVDDPGVDPAAFAAAWNLDPSAPAYFNSGVLLIDLDRARREGSFARAWDIAIRHGQSFKYTDQDALNIVFWKKWRRLGWEWNFQRIMAMEGGAGSRGKEAWLRRRPPVIIHYTSAHKPWLPNSYQPYGWLYWRYLGPPFRRQVMKRYGVGLLDRMRQCLRYWRAVARWHVAARS